MVIGEVDLIPFAVEQAKGEILFYRLGAIIGYGTGLIPGIWKGVKVVTSISCIIQK